MSAGVLIGAVAIVLLAQFVYRRWWWWRRGREVKDRPPLVPPLDAIERDRAERAKRSWTHRWVHRDRENHAGEV